MRARAVLILVCSLSATFAGAGVWRVEQDGSGDFTLIQQAVVAAASGDTILIGPGRYDDLQVRGEMTGTSVAYWDDGRDLSFVGTSVDDVVIGPTSYVPVGTGPQGFHQHADADVHINNLRFENLAAGVVTGRGGLYVESSQFDVGSEGLFVQDPDTCIVNSSTFRNFERYSLVAFRAQYAEVTGCNLDNAVISFNSTANGVVRNCTVTGGSFVYYWLSSGVVEGNDAQCDGNDPCISVSDCDTVRFYDNRILGGEPNLQVSGSSTNAFIERNEFSWPGFANFYFHSHASVYAHDNHINKSSTLTEYVLYTSTYSDTYSATIDMSNNYWFGDSSPAQLDELIHDGNDDPSLNIIVNYEPIRTEPVPVKKSPLGGIKALFR
jgi:hypothetical protein